MLPPIGVLSIVPPSISGVLISGLVKVLFVSVAVETVETKTPSPPSGNVSVLVALWACGAPISVCAWAFELSQ